MKTDWEKEMLPALALACCCADGPIVSVGSGFADATPMNLVCQGCGATVTRQDIPEMTTDQTDTPELRAERALLVRRERDTYSPDHFPGTKAWRINNDAAIALWEFDRDHSLLLQELRAEAEAKRRERGGRAYQ